MTQIPGTGRTAHPILTLALLSSLATVFGCAPKVTNVDATYTLPEGVQTPNATLTVWQDQPTTVYFYTDVAPVDPDPGDQPIGSEVHQRYSSSALHGLILDRTNAETYQLFRRESGGGVRQFTDYSAIQTRQYLPSQTDAFHFVDLTPSSYAPATYVARGVVGGVVNHDSPLTNLATESAPAVQNISDLRAVWWNNTKPSLGPVFNGPKLKIKWTGVPGTDRYLIQVYEFRSDLHSDEERILSGTPAPMYDGQARDVFFGIAAGNVDMLFVGDSSRTDISTLSFKGLTNGSAYMVRIAALDATGHMIGLTIGDSNPLTAFQNSYMQLTRGVRGLGTYQLVRLCACVAKDTVRTGGGGGGGGLGL